MPDYRVVQCFGIKVRPGKLTKQCRRRFMWTAAALSGRFGGKGTQACPYCGTLPRLDHPLNRYLGGEINEEEAEAAMPEYRKKIEEENKT